VLGKLPIFLHVLVFIKFCNELCFFPNDNTDILDVIKFGVLFVVEVFRKECMKELVG
jgi:hypothetical protein